MMTITTISSSRVKPRRRDGRRAEGERLAYMMEKEGKGSALHRVLVELALQRAAMDAEQPRRFGDVAVLLGQHAVDVLPLDAVHRRHLVVRVGVGEVGLVALVQR